MSRITVVEVGPRDGLQNEATILPVEVKVVAWQFGRGGDSHGQGECGEQQELGGEPGQRSPVRTRRGRGGTDGHRSSCT